VSDIDRFQVPWLIDCYERLRRDADALTRGILNRRAEYRRALSDQYGLLFGTGAVGEDHEAKLGASVEPHAS
jgi:hypothetical protein